MAKSAARQAQDVVEDAEEVVGESVEETVEALRERLAEVDESVRSTMQTHPFLGLFGALVGGYAVGRILSRR